eukprot:scaffold22447_cov70-Phaeocystis_antarctica.AAC.9
MGRRGWGWAHCSSPSKKCIAGATKSRAAPARTLSLRLALGRCKAFGAKEQTIRRCTARGGWPPAWRHRRRSMRACGVKFGRVGAFRSALTAKPQPLSWRREFQSNSEKGRREPSRGISTSSFGGSFESSSTLRRASSANIDTCSSRTGSNAGAEVMVGVRVK